MRWYEMFKVKCKKIRMLLENRFQPNIAIMARKCTSLYWEAAKQDFSTTTKIASLPLQGVSYLFVPQTYNIDHIQHPYVDKFGLNFENWKITYIKK